MGPGVLPFRQFVLKVHSRCDLACDHCYVYAHADQSWRDRPKVISNATVAKVGDRIAEHAREHQLPKVRIILHGGEPLLAGKARLTGIARALRQSVEPECELDLQMQTNGVQLDEEFCDLLAAEGIRIGISLDGDRSGNDLHRRYADGRSSYDQVIRAVNLLRERRYQHIYAGLLCTIDLRNDPVATYRALAALEPPALDFLLPHGTHDTPPPGAGDGRTAYADWLAAVFEVWTAEGRRIPVRMFESITRTFHGGTSLTESLGLEASDLAVIEVDGTIEQADSVKVAYHGAPATGFDVFGFPLDAAAAHPAIQARQQGVAGLCATCRECPVVGSCGGGLYAHRNSSANGFDNQSVYCADLKKIIVNVQSWRQPATVDQVSKATEPGSAHMLPADQFDALAAGLGGRAAITTLVTAQQSLRRTVLQLLRERADKAADGAFLAGWDLLARLEQEHAAAFDEVMAHPYVRAWSEQCLRASSRQGAGRPASDGGPLPPEAGYLAAVAAAAAVKAGVLAEIDVPADGGYLCLPALGRLHVGSAAMVTVRVSDGRFEVSDESGKWHVSPENPEPVAGWEPVRDLRAGRFAVRLEDTDPYRNCHQWPAATRLPESEAARWAAQFAAAAALIEQSYPQYASALAAGLSVITPLANDVPGREISAAARQAFGAVGAALPVDGAALALLLVHEFQHVKLGAVLDLFDLCDPADRRLYFAPWREDPRPLGALLQGTYAHLGVTDYWRVRRGCVAGDEALAADEQFARWRMLTAEAVDTLANSGSLTGLGTRFVAGMRATVESWQAEPVSDSAAESAARWAAGRRAAWQRRQQP